MLQEHNDKFKWADDAGIFASVGAYLRRCQRLPALYKTVLAIPIRHPPALRQVQEYLRREPEFFEALRVR